MDKFKLYFYNNRSKIVIISILCIGILSYLIFINNYKEEEEIINIEESKEEEIVEDDYVYIDIKGEVKNKGVYKMLSGSRVIDAIQVAGGLLPNADTSLINLSMKVKDEMSIVIYSKKEVTNFNKTKQEFNEKIDECEKNNDACLSKIEDASDKDLININKASKNDFMSLPGIGESKAKAIIDYRNSYGTFKTIDEIKDVKGIGENIFEKIKEYLTV